MGSLSSMDVFRNSLECFEDRTRRSVSNVPNGPWYVHDNETLTELLRFQYNAEIVFWILSNIVAAVGIIANALVLVKISTNPRLRTPSNHFIANLAFSDLVVLLALTIVRSLVIYQIWNKLRAILLTIQYTQHLCIQSTALVLAAMSFTRYHFTVHPLKARAEWTSSRVWKLCGAIWIVSAFLYVPIIFGVLIAEDSNSLTRFVPIPLQRKLFSTIRLLPMFIFPAAIILTSYCKIIITFKDRQKIMEKKTSSSITFENTVGGQTKKLTRMVILIIVVFFISWGPYQIYMTALDLRPFFLQSTPLRWKTVVMLSGLLRLLAYTGCALNPFIYAHTNPAFLKFRMPYFKLFISSKGSSSENSLSTKTTTTNRMSV